MNVPDTLKLLADQHFPGLWKRCLPRVYDQLGRFHSPKYAAASLVNSVMAAMRYGIETSPAIRNQYITASLLDRHQVPTFFVTSNLLRAAAQTNLPPDMSWVDIPMPHPALLFVFEQGAVKHPEDGEISFVAIARPQAKDSIQHSQPGSPLGTMIDGGFMMLTAAHETAGFDQYDLSMSERISPTIEDIKMVMQDEFQRPVNNPAFEDTISMAGQQFNHWLTVLAIKLVLVMNARPEQVSAGSHRRTVKSKHAGEAPIQFWTPNILGRSYVSESEVDHAADPHGKVRLHWRRGHFNRQPYGPNHSLRKTIWREPVLVGEA